MSSAAGVATGVSLKWQQPFGDNFILLAKKGQ